MKKITIDRLAMTSITLIILVAIFLGYGKFNFLAYSSGPMLSAIRQNTINKMTINDGKTVSELEYKDGVWYAKKENSFYKADQERITSLLKSVSDLQKEQVVTNSPSQQSVYGTNNQNVTLVSPDKTFVLYIGNNAGMSKNYVRIGGDNDIFIADGFNEVFIPNDYRDLTIGIVNDESMVSKVTLADGSTQMHFTEGDWFINDQKIDKEKVSFFINDLKTLKVRDVYKNTGNLSNPNFVIRVTEKDAETEVNFYNNGDTYLVTLPNENNVYVVDASDVDYIKQTVSDFLY